MTVGPRIGVQFQTHGVPAAGFSSAVDKAVDLGVDSVFLWDHLVPFTGTAADSAWETWTLLGSIAPGLRSSSATPGVLVSPLTFRRPAVLARAAATVAALANGRCILGVGAGGFDPDDELTETQMSRGARSSQLVHGLAILREEVRAQCDRHDVRIEIWVGGDGPRITIPAAARFGDGWSGFGPPERWARGVALFDDLYRGADVAVRSVLLTDLDEPVDLAAYAGVGADHVVRSLRPQPDGTFDLSPVATLLDQRMAADRGGSQ